MNKPNFRPIAPLDVDDDALERVNERLGVPTMVRPAAKAQQDVVTASRPTVPAPKRQQKLTVRIPGYLVDESQAGRLGAGEPRFVILCCSPCRKDGYTVEASDLSAGGRGQRLAQFGRRDGILPSCRNADTMQKRYGQPYTRKTECHARPKPFSRGKCYDGPY